ncbi:MAG TPA: cellulase family glycosylhydrolase [Phycisphaerae bacterium]|nr:cellulase family glycosylhydrolase [Phycisphaerae bacterium]
MLTLFRSFLPNPCRWPLLLFLLAAFHICAGCLPPHHRARRDDPALPAPLHPMTMGLCEDYPKSSRSLAHARADLDACRASGAQVLRIAFSWLDMQPRPGQLDFSFWDDFVRIAVDEYHIRLIPYVCYTPRWAAGDPSDNFWHAPPRDPADFARFLTALVTRYRSRIHSWELWNEPDNPAYWSGSVPQFAALVEAGSHAVRQADPHALVVLGGIAWNADFLARLFQDPALLPAVDVVNMHAYYETWSPDSLQQLPHSIHRLHDLIALHAGRQRLWLAEIGYSDFRRPDGFVSGQYTARFSFEHTPAYQADYLLRAAALAASTGQVDLFAWYRINDLPDGVNVIGDVNNRHLGILDTQGRPKPAFDAFRRASHSFSLPARLPANAAKSCRPRGKLRVSRPPPPLLPPHACAAKLPPSPALTHTVHAL